MSRWLLDGNPADSVPITDRGLHYGDGLFETIAVRDGAPRFLDLHLRRLAGDLERLGIPVPAQASLAAEVRRVATECAHGAAKIIVTRGTGQRGYRPPANPEPCRIVGIIPAAPLPRQHYSRGVMLRLCDTPVSRNPVTAGMKTLNRLEQVLARAEWSDPDVVEGLMLDGQGHVVSGTMTNVFIVRDGRLHTPPVRDAGIAGIMRGLVLAQSGHIDLEAAEAHIAPADLRDATELFVTNSQIGIWPVRRFEATSFVPGPWTRKLMQRLAAIGVEECAA